jgi:DNA polymerase
MSLSPEQQLRAYVEYFRDLGVYEMHRRDAPQIKMPERWRELPTQAKPAAQQTGSKPSVPESRTAAKTPPPSVRLPMQAPVPRAPQAPMADPARSYFETQLPPELAAPMPKPISFDALAPLPAEIVPAGQRAAALEAVRQEIGDCTRCSLAYAGRHNLRRQRRQRIERNWFGHRCC